MSITAEQLTSMMSPDVAELNPHVTPAAKRSKWGNVPTTVDGHRFASKKEATHYAGLKLLADGGLITNLQLQPRFTLHDAYVDSNGDKVRAVVYVADFMWIDAKTGRTHVLDSKGVKTDVFKIKEKLFRAKYPEIIFEVR